MDSRPYIGPWACTMKLCDVQTNPGLLRGHGLIRGWAYTRHSMVLVLELGISVPIFTPKF